MAAGDPDLGITVTLWVRKKSNPNNFHHLHQFSNFEVVMCNVECRSEELLPVDFAAIIVLDAVDANVGDVLYIFVADVGLWWWF